MRRVIVAALLSGSLCTTSRPARAQEGASFFSGDSQHRRVLTQRMDETIRQQVAAEIIGSVDVAFGTVFVVVGATQWQKDRPLAMTFVVGFGTMDALVVSSLFMSRDARSSILEGAIHVTPALAAFGFAVADNPGPFPRLTTGSMAIGYGLASTVTIINRALTPTPYTVLRAHRARLDEPRDLTDQERRSMHLAMLGARGPLPRWLGGAPMVITGAVAMAPAFDDSYAKNSRYIAGLGGGLQLLTGLVNLSSGPVGRYENDVKTLGISIAAAPGGAMVHGFF
jgi:hypothetical protein